MAQPTFACRDMPWVTVDNMLIRVQITFNPGLPPLVELRFMGVTHQADRLADICGRTRTRVLGTRRPHNPCIQRH